VLSDIEIIEIVEIEWHDAVYKVYLKDLVLDNIPAHYSINHSASGLTQHFETDKTGDIWNIG